MDLLKMFSKNMDLERRPMRPAPPEPDNTSDVSFDRYTSKTYSSGTSYAKKYVEEENRIALNAAKQSFEPSRGGKMDEVSVGTVPSNVTEILRERDTEVYRNFNFEHRSQETLPIFDYKDEIVRTVQTHSVTIIEGSTGCGKSTQVPQFILDNCQRQNKHCNIVVCQPRRIAAHSIAQRVCKERQWTLGSMVGCQVGMFKAVSKDTRLLYCTTGVLLRKLIGAKNMLDYTHVIVDEVHERDQEMDFLILVIRKMLRTSSRQVKVILMSATFNAEKFAEYFAYVVQPKFINAPIISIGKKKVHVIHTHYLCQLNSLGAIPETSPDEPKVTEQMIQFSQKLINIFDEVDANQEVDHEDQIDYDGVLVKPRYAVLVFLPGIWEIEEMHNLMSLQKDKSKWDIVVLHSSITSDEQNKVFSNPPRGYRRIILSTNIAESSITIHNVKYVVDFCLTKQLVTDPTTNFQCLELTWASKANCEQRKGRVGRVMDGRVYRLVPKIFYDTYLPHESDPEIIRSPLEQVVLQAKMLDMGPPKALLALAIDPPDLSNLERTVLLLKEVGGLIDQPGTFNEADGDLTDLGKIMAALPIDVHLSKLIALGQAFNVLRDSIIMAASMAMKSMFSNPFQKRMEAYNTKVHWADGSSSDCMAYLNAYRVWQREITANRIKLKSRNEFEWAKRNFVQIKVMHEVDFMVGDLTRRLELLGIKETSGPEKMVLNDINKNFLLKIVIAGAFYPNYFIRSQSNLYEYDSTFGTRGLAGLDPTRTVYLQGWKIEQPGKLYAKRIQEVFKNVVPSYNQALIEFDGSTRIYVMFSDKFYGHEQKYKQVPGKVSPSVYKALKMKKLGMDVEIPILDNRSAKRMAENLEIPSMTSTFYSKNNHDALKKCTPKTLPKLPSLSCTIISIEIVHFLNPGKFWVYVKKPNKQNEFTEITSYLNEPNLIALSLEPIDSELLCGELVAARWEDGKYCRAVVESFYEIKQEKVANLLYIDYGYRCSVRCADLQRIKKNSILAEKRALAFECRLVNLEPSKKRNSKGKWSHESIELFKKQVENSSNIYGEVYSVVDSVVSLTLKLKNYERSQKEVNINELLVNKGMADHVEESYLSNYNHNLRLKIKNCEESEYYEFLQYDKNFLVNSYPEPPPRSECNQILKLRGPSSPLEINLTSLSITTASKAVHIEPNSVNSVLLDTNPEDPHDRLLVSSIVSQNQSSTTLTLRNTTLLPNIPGLTSLLCLIFAPKMELRRSTVGTYYIGALCGLGYNPLNKNIPLLPEHDMEICFDTKISIDDIQNINRLRHWMSMAIYTKTNEEDDYDSQILHCQRKVFEFISKLTDRPTEPQKKMKLVNSGHWNLYDETLLMAPKKVVVKSDSIYSLHSALMLNDGSSIETEEMYNHLRLLRDESASDPRLPEIINIECKLCNKFAVTRADLRLHLFTEEHKNNEKSLNA